MCLKTKTGTLSEAGLGNGEPCTLSVFRKISLAEVAPFGGKQSRLETKVKHFS